MFLQAAGKLEDLPSIDEEVALMQKKSQSPDGDTSLSASAKKVWHLDSAVSKCLMWPK